MPYVFVVIDLENPKDRYMHTTRSRTREQSNLEFLVARIRALG